MDLSDLQGLRILDAEQGGMNPWLQSVISLNSMGSQAALMLKAQYAWIWFIRFDACSPTIAGFASCQVEGSRSDLEITRDNRSDTGSLPVQHIMLQEADTGGIHHETRRVSGRQT
ncbi:MAG: hypothetical protein D6704_12270 [Nitrospirae bacterium]|nr:MAG: hypothetical protein D6704_12270 [Nitrospirota bacterium]